MAQWNLTRFAETLLPLIDENKERAVEKATLVLEEFPEIYGTYWLEGMRAKLGLATEEEDDFSLASDLLTAMEGQDVDYTNFFRDLANLTEDDEGLPCLKDWLPRWRKRFTKESVSHSKRATAMNKVNPLYIPRNHLVEEALTAAVNNRDYSKFERLMEALEQPFKKQSDFERFAMPAPQDFGPYTTYCGT